MKTFKTLSIIAVALVITFFSCKKEEEITVPYNCIANMIADQTAQNTINNTGINLSQPGTINGVNGVEITYSTNSFMLNGLLVSGNIDVEIFDANDNKDMLLMDFPTVTDAGGLLTSGGILEFNPTQNGQTLTINPSFPIQVSFPASSGAPMQLWSGTRTSDGVLTWNGTPLPTTVTVDTAWNGNTPTYSYTFPITDATVVYNCDDLVNTGTPSDVLVTLPEGMNGSNSTVYCYFRDINSVVTFYDNDNDRTFEWSSSLPAGQVVQFVAVSQIEGIRKWNVSDTISLIAGTHPHIVTEMDVALCADALRLSIKDALVD